MKPSHQADAWRAVWQIGTLAAAFVALFWGTWAVSNDDRLVGWTGCGLMITYLSLSYFVARRAQVRDGLTVQLMVASVLALVGFYVLGAIVALALWGEPVGPSN